VDRWSVVAAVAARQDGVILAGQAVAAGFARHEIASLCRSGRWLRLARGHYLLRADAVGDQRARIRAAVSASGPAACAVLAAAAELHGIAGLRQADGIHVNVPGSSPRPQRLAGDVDLHQLVLQPADVTTVDGIATTTVSRTLADVILRVGRFEAVCALDSALNRKLLTQEEFDGLPDLIRGRRGAARARRFLAEVDGRARSPLETRTRLRCADGGVPPDEVGYLVRDEYGYVLAEADMAWLREKVIAEADGAGPHSLPDALFGDRNRQNILVNAGWQVLRFTWADTLRPDHIPDVVRQALGARPR
jgi:predicted transcriptional regulator of viral defense system